MCGWRESSGLESVMGCPSKCHLAVLESGEAAATKALLWLWLWLAGWLALAAWTSWASFTLRFLYFSRNWRKAAERQPKRQAARHIDGDKSLSSSVSTRNAAESTNMSAAGVWRGRGAREMLLLQLHLAHATDPTGKGRSRGCSHKLFIINFNFISPNSLCFIIKTQVNYLLSNFSSQWV